MPLDPRNTSPGSFQIHIGRFACSLAAAAVSLFATATSLTAEPEPLTSDDDWDTTYEDPVAPEQPGGANAACAGLVPQQGRMVCSGFEPNWAITIECRNSRPTASFVDPLTLQSHPGSVTVTGQHPWLIETNHGVVGVIAFTPNGCPDESERVFDFTMRASKVPGLSGRIYPICCRVE